MLSILKDKEIGRNKASGDFELDEPYVPDFIILSFSVGISNSNLMEDLKMILLY